ncbi:hypothetical protein bpr_II073 (plasmid) [Butyrivibrio proteoclasticus B316]|uniref:Uncharacterized protein n=1 Tax=Butyrivibrio proteoclasticus (strain ATCC 51982 / DSM 14932 / B316) TaxID=515622 RepID=E0S3N1_BUTPB|nr:hypothetical protein [Butyrivibrio proteoclasticus]ADL36013.1 hypothetical protein bpr_II073 [Butyrivibrio proteoclasticus B316]
MANPFDKFYTWVFTKNIKVEMYLLIIIVPVTLLGFWFEQARSVSEVLCVIAWIYLIGKWIYKIKT